MLQWAVRTERCAETPPHFSRQSVALSKSQQFDQTVDHPHQRHTRVNLHTRRKQVLGETKSVALPLTRAVAIFLQLGLTQNHRVHHSVIHWQTVLHAICHIKLPVSLPKEMSAKFGCTARLHRNVPLTYHAMAQFVGTSTGTADEEFVNGISRNYIPTKSMPRAIHTFSSLQSRLHPAE